MGFNNQPAKIEELDITVFKKGIENKQRSTSIKSRDPSKTIKRPR